MEDDAHDDIDTNDNKNDVDADDDDHDGDDDDEAVASSRKWHSWSYRLHHGSFLIYCYDASFHGYYHLYHFHMLLIY